MIEENLARLRAYRKHSPLRAVGRDATLGPGEDLHRKAAEEEQAEAEALVKTTFPFSLPALGQPADAAA